MRLFGWEIKLYPHLENDWVQFVLSSFLNRVYEPMDEYEKYAKKMYRR